MNMRQWVAGMIRQKEVAAVPVMTHPGIEQNGNTVRQAVSDAIHDLPLAVQPSGTETGTTGSKEISDRNFDIADNFMNSL